MLRGGRHDSSTIAMGDGDGAMDGPNGWQDGSDSAMAIAINGGGSKEGNGNGDMGGKQAMATVTKRVMAMAMKGGGQQRGQWQRWQE
jgi:hypothetical protein